MTLGYLDVKVFAVMQPRSKVVRKYYKLKKVCNILKVIYLLYILFLKFNYNYLFIIIQILR